MVACSNASARVDYGTGTPCQPGVAEKNTHRIRCHHNPSTRSYFTSVLVELHWLPVLAPITFKIAIFVFKIKDIRYSDANSRTSRIL